MAKASERGAVAVEFAILAPVLIMLLLGIMEFGRAYSAQITLSNAAREGVRVMAINNSATAAATATAKAAAKNAATTLNPVLQDDKIVFTYQATPAATPIPTACAANVQVKVTIDYTLKTMTGIAGPFAMKGVGTMQCGG
ncbi:TadE/TadG family type IV pilus assembly protein [Arthrobacter sp. LAR12-1-1.1]|uniref:TadE/TadG family type IV pilus assembly protein n=1 Tax=Arthrobacter sp. LAR12-1-1.1 TaxID=3135215 RepID=UPI00347C33EF